jgi:hypothetical protein
MIVDITGITDASVTTNAITLRFINPSLFIVLNDLYITRIKCIYTIATAIAIINPKNKYFVSYLIAKAEDSLFFVLLN